MDHNNTVEYRRKRPRIRKSQTSRQSHSNQISNRQSKHNHRKRNNATISDVQKLIEDGLRMQREKDLEVSVKVDDFISSVPMSDDVPVPKKSLNRSIISQWYNHCIFGTTSHAVKYVDERFSKWPSFCKLVLPYSRDRTMRNVFQSSFATQFSEMYDRAGDIFVSNSGEVMMLSKFGELFVKRFYREQSWNSVFNDRTFIDTCFIPNVHGTRNMGRTTFAVMGSNTNQSIVSQYISLVKLAHDDLIEPTEDILFKAAGNTYTNMVPDRHRIVLYGENRVSYIPSSQIAANAISLLSFPANCEMSIRTVAQLPTDDSLAYSQQVQYIALRNGKILRLDMRMPGIRATRYFSSIDRFVVGAMSFCIDHMHCFSQQPLLLARNITGEVCVWDMRYSSSTAMCQVVEGTPSEIRYSRCYVSPDDDILISPCAGYSLDTLTIGIFNLREAIRSGNSDNKVYNLDFASQVSKYKLINNKNSNIGFSQENSKKPKEISFLSSSMPLPAYCQSGECDVVFARHQFSSIYHSEVEVSYHRNCHMRFRDLSMPYGSNDVISFRGLDNI